MKKVYFILLIIAVPVILSQCTSYEKPILLPNNNNTLTNSVPSFTCNVDGELLSTGDVSCYLSNNDSILNFQALFLNTQQSTINFKIPFYPNEGKYDFKQNNQHFFSFEYKNTDSVLQNCSLGLPKTIDSNGNFATINISNIQKIDPKGYSVSGEFNFSIIKKCNFFDDTINVKDAVFKNVLIK